ncbi:glycosyltransferase family 2 protein [Flavobacterium sp.]|uniref:glycosyltransferase family 2 protein n=1 Tax=Flavobacterium sp. TaxID=239 RepID=UPI0026228532|nr:glycosyltransferase [Flavobacterium sp.]
MIIAKKIFEFYYYFYTVYSISIFAFYIFLTVISLKAMIHYFKRNSFINYQHLYSSELAPSVSILAPMFNEEENAVAAIKSLLNLHYVNYDIIVINDGSTDATSQKIIEFFEMESINKNVYPKIPFKKVNNVYKSKNKFYEKILFIDKENGGKSDSLNAGLNFSNSDYVLCIDGDCILMHDALIKMVKPVLDSTETVIASGGVVRVANDCIFKNGNLIEINLSNKFLVKTQILEYIRSFLLARMAWSKLKGLMVVSGAFGILNRKIAIDVGGYLTNTIGEDMEIIVRMQRYMYKKKKKFILQYIPDPLCWTEAPENLKILYRQRKRWTIGNIQTLVKHRKMNLNRKYKLTGLFSFPFWIIYERWGPIIEISGIVFFICASFLGYVNWIYTISFFIATYLFSIMYSFFSILCEEITFNQYKKKYDILKLLSTAIIEPITYHIFLLFPTLMGNIDILLKRKIGWGKMERKGLERTN